MNNSNQNLNTVDISKWTDKVHLGDCLEIMRQFPDKCCDAIITSPPYW